jgi:hypothetical protein
MTPHCESSRQLEHLRQDGEHRGQIGGAQDAEPFAEALAIDGPELIESDAAILASESAHRPKWIPVTACGHRRDDNGSEVVIQFVG